MVTDVPYTLSAESKWRRSCEVPLTMQQHWLPPWSTRCQSHWPVSLIVCFRASLAVCFCLTTGWKMIRQGADSSDKVLVYKCLKLHCKKIRNDSGWKITWHNTVGAEADVWGEMMNSSYFEELAANGKFFPLRVLLQKQVDSWPRRFVHFLWKKQVPSII